MVDVDYRSHTRVHAAGLKQLSARVHRGPTSPVTTRKVCFSFAAYARNLINHLESCNIPISKGLSEEEFLNLENTFNFTFPPDLKSILQEGLPVGVGFPNWRSGSEQELREMLELPVAGLCYQIEGGRFWWEKWGRKPKDSGSALRVARQAFKEAPTLVPIYSHCYMPSLPILAGNPVFSVYEKDIFYCGYDLADFFEREAFVPHDFYSTSISEEEEEGNPFTRTETQRNSNKKLQSRRKRLGHNDFDMDYLSRILLAERSNFESGADCFSTNQEIQERKSVSEKPLQLLERPETLVRSAGNSPRMDQQIVSRYMNLHEKTLPNTILTHFTMAAPPWAAKTARRIDFWTDLVEGHEMMKDVPQESFISAFKVEDEELSSSEFERGRCCSKRWLSGYFEEMAKRLSRGGWKEEEIKEMVEAVLPAEGGMRALNGEGLVEAVAMNVDAISDCLRQGGWSGQDVVDVLSFEVSCLEEKQHAKQKRGCCSKMTSKPKAGSLADYFSKT